MSMRTYAFEDYGLVLTEEAMKAICEKVCEELDEDESYGMALYDMDICSCAGNFSGEAFPITDKGADTYNGSEDFDDDSVYYIPTKRYSTLFEAAYKDINEMIAEFKENLGEYLPDNFDYRSNIRHIIGTTFG